MFVYFFIQTEYSIIKDKPNNFDDDLLYQLTYRIKKTNHLHSASSLHAMEMIHILNSKQSTLIHKSKHYHHRINIH